MAEAVAPIPEVNSSLEPAGSSAGQPTAVSKLPVEWEYEPGKKITLKEFKDLQDKTKNLQKGVTQKLQETARLRQEAEQLIEFANKNPREALKRFGANELEIAQQILSEHLERQQMTPDQRRASELQAERDQLKADKAKRDQELLQQQDQIQIQQVQQHFERQLGEALTKVDMPRMPESVARAAMITEAYLKNGIDAPAEQIAQDARKSLETEAQHLTAAMDGRQLAAFLGKESVEKLRKYFLEGLNSPKPKTVSDHSPRERKITEPRSYTRGEYRALLDKRM